MASDNLVKDLKENQVVLVLIPKSIMVKKRLEIMKAVSMDSGGICLTSFNQPYSSIKESFEKNSIEISKFFFIDVLSKGVYSAKKTENCAFVSSPEDMTEIGITLTNVLRSGEIDTAIFESLSTLLIYQDSLPVIQFAHSIINKSRVAGVKMIITSIIEDSNTELIKDLHMFVDKVVEIEK